MNKKVFEIPKSTNAGIYMLYNLNNHKVYIGETNNFNHRAKHHQQCLRNNTHSNSDLQTDYNSGCEISFVILEDAGRTCEKDTLKLKEKQYIFAFRDRNVKTYNHETSDQLKEYLFFYMVTPSIDNIRKDFQQKFNCALASLERCQPTTLKEKFKERI